MWDGLRTSWAILRKLTLTRLVQMWVVGGRVVRVGERVGRRGSYAMLGSEIRANATDVVPRGRSRTVWLGRAMSSKLGRVDRRRGGWSVIDVLETRVWLRHGGTVDRSGFIRGGGVVVLFVVVVAFPGKVFGAFVLMGRTALLD